MTEENEEVETEEKEEKLSLREELEQSLKGEEVEEEEDTDGEDAEGDEDTGEDTGTEPVEDETDAVEEEEQEEVEVKELDAPEHWAVEDRELFSTQTDEVKGYLLKRHNEMESGFTQKTQDLAEQRKSIEGLTQFVDKWTPHTSNMGIPLLHGLEKLLEHDQQLRNGTPEQKQQVALQLLSQYGINMNTTSEEDEYADPQLKAMQDQINMLKGNETTRQQQTEQAVTQRQQSIQQEVQTASDTFKAETDDKGVLKFPHFDTLKTDMGVLVQSGQAGTGNVRDQLEAAYNKALWMNTETREQLLASKQSSLKDEEIKKQGKAAAQAKKSAKANKKGTNAKAEKPQASVSLRDDLAEQIKEAQAM